MRVCVRERERGGETSTAGTKRLCNAQSLPVIVGGSPRSDDAAVIIKALRGNENALGTGIPSENWTSREL